jgi:LCP family protein required for cell wall assembly
VAALSDADPSSDAPAAATPDAPKRRGRGRRRHAVAKVILAVVVVLAMATGLTVVFLYRHLNGNLDVIDVTKQLDNRPAKVQVEGPKEPLNVLVMGSDTRQGVGNAVDKQFDIGERSDTTILLHLSADRERAYGISIPRDSVVDRPKCTSSKGAKIPAASGVLWNDAYSVGGPACTIQQFEQLSGVRLDHFVVVDFNGFRGMVDAIGGVQVCIPQDIVDPAHGINIPAGNRKLEGQQALNYVRERYVVGNGSDTGRMKRQQAFIASMAHQVVSSGTLARPDRLVRFLEAATQSLTLDDGLGNLTKIAKIGLDFRGIGLDNIQFITIPNTVDPNDPNHLVWTPQAKLVWKKIANDEPLTRRLAADVISAGNVPGQKNPSGNGSTSPSSSPSSSPTGDPDQADAQALEDAGLCA